MADILAGSEASVTKRYRDMGDGTFAEVVSSAADAASSSLPTATARMASSAATTNATLVKASAGKVSQMTGKNAAAYDVYLVLYDSAANPPVPGTTTIRKKIPIPAGAVFVFDHAMSFATGIGYAFTKNAPDNDTTALAAGDVLQFNLDYI